MSLQLVWTLLPVAAFGSCCLNTGKVKVGGSTGSPGFCLRGQKRFLVALCGLPLEVVCLFFVLFCFLVCFSLVAFFFIVCPSDK